MNRSIYPLRPFAIQAKGRCISIIRSHKTNRKVAHLPMSGSYLLLPSEELAERPFTDPSNTTHDYAALEFLLMQVCTIMRQLDGSIAQTSIQHIHWVEDEGRRHRMIINNAPDLMNLSSFIWVGFFGQRRPNADPHPVEEMDRELVVDLYQHPGILAYTTVAKADGDFGNLILFGSPDAVNHWATSPLHLRSAQVLSPPYYYSIRIHSGILPGTLLSDGKLRLEQTKYFDYRGMLPWRGVRYAKSQAVPVGQTKVSA